MTLSEMKKKYHLSVSPGNIKLGNIPSVSLSPISTCNHMLSCYKSGCYALRMLNFRNQIAQAWTRNTTLWSDDHEAFKELLKDRLRTMYAHGAPKYFRWHVGGDIPNIGYWEMMRQVAKEMDDVQFMVFTKKYLLADLFKKKPDNLAVLFSMWPDENPQIQKFIDSSWNKIRDIRRAKIAWLSKDPRIHSEGFNAYTCHGSCMNCKQCWKDTRDIILNEH